MFFSEMSEFGANVRISELVRHLLRIRDKTRMLLLNCNNRHQDKKGLKECHIHSLTNATGCSIRNPCQLLIGQKIPVVPKNRNFRDEKTFFQNFFHFFKLRMKSVCISLSPHELAGMILPPEQIGRYKITHFLKEPGLSKSPL